MSTSTALDPLIFDLVDWCAREPRAYADVIDAWRTSCPRLTVWEDATERGLVTRTTRENGQTFVAVTAAGRAFLDEYGRKFTAAPLVGSEFSAA